MKIIDPCDRVKEIIEKLFQEHKNKPIEFVYSEKLFNYLLKTKKFEIFFRSKDKEEYKNEGYIRLFSIERRIDNMYKMTIRPNRNPDLNRNFDINNLLDRFRVY